MQETPQLEQGYSKIANEILEKLCYVKLSSYQTRIVFCIIRKTYGYHKKEDWISNSQFVLMTGLRASHVSRSVSELLRMNLVTKRGNKIAFQKDWRLWKELPNGVRRHDVTKRGNLELPNGVTPLPNGVRLLPNGGNTKDNITKDNITKDNITKEQGCLFPKQITLFIERFNKLFHASYRETDKIKDMLNTRLKTYSIDKILQATHNLSLSEFHQGKNDRKWKADPYFLLRNDGQIDKWLNYEPKKAFKSEDLDIYDKLPVTVIKN